MRKRRPRKRFLSNYKFRLAKTRKPKFRFNNKRIVETGKIYTKVFHDQFCCIVWIKHQKKFRLINVLKLSEEGLKKLVAKKHILNKKRCNHLLTFPGKNICDVLRNEMRRNKEEFEGFSILKTKLDHVSRLLLRFIVVPKAGESNKSSTVERSSETPLVEAIPLNSPDSNANSSLNLNPMPMEVNATPVIQTSHRERKCKLPVPVYTIHQNQESHGAPIHHQPQYSDPEPVESNKTHTVYRLTRKCKLSPGPAQTICTNHETPGTSNRKRSVQIKSDPEESNETHPQVPQKFHISQRKRKLSPVSVQQVEHLQTNRQLYPCEKCQRKFTSLSNVKRHQREAKICSGSSNFTSLANVKQHQQEANVCSGEPKFTCSQCGAKLQSNSSLVRHQKNNSCRLYKPKASQQKIEITTSGPDSIDKLEDNLKDAQAVLDSRKQLKLSGKYNEDDSKKLQNSLEIAKKLVSLLEIELTERIEVNIEEELDSGFIQEESSIENEAENSLEDQEDEILLNSDENLEVPRKRKKVNPESEIVEDEILLNSDENLETPRKRKKMNPESENVEDEVTPKSPKIKKSRLTPCPYCGESYADLHQHKNVSHSNMKEFPCSFCSKKYFTDRGKNRHERNCDKKKTINAGTDLNKTGSLIDGKLKVAENLHDLGYLEELATSSNFEANASSSGILHANDTRHLEEDSNQKSDGQPLMSKAQEQSAELPEETRVPEKTSLGKIKARRPSQSFMSIRQRRQSVEFYSPCQRNSNAPKLESHRFYCQRKFRLSQCVCKENTQRSSSTATEPKVLLHRLISPFICNICNKPAQNRTALMTHWKIHNKVREEFYCSKCNMKFYTKSNADKHEESCCNQKKLKPGPKSTKKYCKYCFGICGFEKRNDIEMTIN